MRVIRVARGRSEAEGDRVGRVVVRLHRHRRLHERRLHCQVHRRRRSSYQGWRRVVDGHAHLVVVAELRRRGLAPHPHPLWREVVVQ